MQYKNLAAIILLLSEKFKRLARIEEIENQEIKRKMLQEQKRLREKLDKKKSKDQPEKSKSKHETQEERLARVAKEKTSVPQVKKPRNPQNFGGEGVIDVDHVVGLIEEKKLCLPNLLLNVDLEVILKHDADQSEQINGVFVKRLRFLTNRETSITHLSVLISHRNGLREEEWPNFEFYPCTIEN